LLDRKLVILCFAWLASTAFCDRLSHTDGTTIEGEIVEQSNESITVKTKYGTLRYPRMEIMRIERETSGGTMMSSGPRQPPRKSLLSLLPAGPINPLAPPNLPNLAAYHVPSTTQTATAATSAGLSLAPNSSH
jgi:hypothetical protein